MTKKRSWSSSGLIQALMNNVMIKRLSAMAGGVLLSASVGSAATWYVDSAATGANNGTSWANAWTALTSISGIASGDTVYISGGPAGSTRNYSYTTGFPPYNGSSATSRITYQIGQDSAHNGLAVIDLQGTEFLNSEIANVNILGSTGDGQMHIFTTNILGIGWIGDANAGQNFRVSYINFGGQATCGLDIQSPAGMEFDHNYFFKIQETAGSQFDHFLGGNDSYKSTWGVNSVHDNKIYIPRQPGQADYGDDCVTLKSGLDMYNNFVYGYITNYTGSQHQDGFQPLWSDYDRIYNNVFVNMANSAASPADYYGDIDNLYIYNNIITCDSSGSSGSPMRGFDIFPGTTENRGFNYRNTICANNLFVDVGQSGNGGAGCVRMDGGGVADYFGCVCANNLSVNINGGYDVQSDVATWANIGDTSVAGAASFFLSYTPFAATKNNFHLAATATSLIGKGTNLSAYFNADFDGNPRPAAGPWDIGPYVFNATPNTNPVIYISQSSLNVGSALPNTSVTNSITVQNIGGGTLTGQASVPAPFAIVGGRTYSLTNGQSQNVFVSFNPGASTNTFNSTITFTGGGGGSASVSGQVVAVLPGMTFASTSGTIASPMAVSSGGYIYLTTGDGTEGVANGGSATYFFNLTSAGQYTVSASVLAPNAGTKSFWVNIDAMPVDPTMICDVYPYSNSFQPVAFSWRGNSTTVTNDQFSPQIFNLTAGTHQLIIVGREQGVEIGAITIAPYSSSRPVPPHLISVGP
jgi:hypothetical protein